MGETNTPDGRGAPVDSGRTTNPQAVGLAPALHSNLEYARRLYGETGNPLYAIWALHIVSDPRLATARGVDSACAIPEWCLDWLHPALGNVLAIARGVRRRGEPVAVETREKRVLTPRGAAQRVPQALGLTRRGKNAFRDFGADKADIELAGRLDFLRSVRTPIGDRPQKLEDLKIDAGTVREDGVVRKRVKRGKALRRD